MNVCDHHWFKGFTACECTGVSDCDFCGDTLDFWEVLPFETSDKLYLFCVRCVAGDRIRGCIPDYSDWPELLAAQSDPELSKTAKIYLMWRRWYELNGSGFGNEAPSQVFEPMADAL